MVGFPQVMTWWPFGIASMEFKILPVVFLATLSILTIMGKWLALYGTVPVARLTASYGIVQADSETLAHLGVPALRHEASTIGDKGLDTRPRHLVTDTPFFGIISTGYKTLALS